MTTQEIHKTLVRLIAQKIDRRIPAEQVRLDARLHEDLGIDSLGMTEMLFEIEEAFGATLDVSRPEMLYTVGDAVNAIAGQLRIPLAS
jgi:acyl carrier protein